MLNRALFVRITVDDQEDTTAKPRTSIATILAFRRRLPFHGHPDGSNRVDNDSVREVALAGQGTFPCSVRPLGDRHPLLPQDRADRPDRAALVALFLNDSKGSGIKPGMVQTPTTCNQNKEPARWPGPPNP